MRRASLMVGIVVALASGCVPIVREGDVRGTHKPPPGSVEPLSGGQAVVLLGSGGTEDTHDLLVCIRKELRDVLPDHPVVEASVFRQAMSAPVLPSPQTKASDVRLALMQPTVAAARDRFNVRYLVLAYASSDTIKRGGCGGGDYTCERTRHSFVDASVWDLVSIESIGTYSARADGDETIAPGFMILDATEGPVCEWFAKEFSADMGKRKPPIN